MKEKPITNTLINKVQKAGALWRILVGFCPVPSEYQLGTWVRQFSETELEYAFRRTGSKFNPQRVNCPDPVVVHRYATGVLLNERQRLGD